MKHIYIENIDDYILIDDEDYESVNQYKWHINKNYSSTRALAFVNQKKVTLPHFITKRFNAYQKVKNLDFRRQNIGIDEHKYRYRKPQANASSRYKGVQRLTLRTGQYKWVSNISDGEDRIYLGIFESELEAAKAYNDAVMKYWNGNGYMNDINKDESMEE